jgi:hypothetical protein
LKYNYFLNLTLPRSNDFARGAGRIERSLPLKSDPAGLMPGE